MSLSGTGPLGVPKEDNKEGPGPVTDARSNLDMMGMGSNLNLSSAEEPFITFGRISNVDETRKN